MRRLGLIVLLVAAVACGGDAAPTNDGGGGEQPSAEPATAATSSVDAGSTAPSTTEPARTGTVEPASSNDSREDLPFENGEGFFVVDGERIDPEYVVSCIPFDASEFGGAASHPDDLAINAIKNRTALEIQVGYEMGAGARPDSFYDAVHVSPIFLRSGDAGQESFEASFVTDADGAWYSSETDNTIQLSLGNATGTPLAEAPMVREGNRITGTVTLPQTWPDGASGSVTVSYDLSFSSEQFDCSTR